MGRIPHCVTQQFKKLTGLCQLRVTLFVCSGSVGKAAV